MTSAARKRAERATTRALARFGARVAWTETPRPGRALALLPPPIAEHPCVAFADGGGEPMNDAALRDLLERVREDRLHWPATLHDAASPQVLADFRELDAAAVRIVAALLTDLDAEDAVALCDADTPPPSGFRSATSEAEIDPGRLKLVVGAAHSPAVQRAALGGVETRTPAGPADPLPWAARARFVSPWNAEEMGVAEGLDALATLRRAAQANSRSAVTAGFSRWKRRNAAPFLTGPAGPPRHASASQAPVLAADSGARLALWGMAEAPQNSEAPLRLEDGFLRSVGLGLRHVPPASLVVDSCGLYFDATRSTDLERLVLTAEFPAPLLARAHALRRRIAAQGVTKYNLRRSAPLPRTDRPRVLVPGQVEGDASLRWGAPGPRTNAELIRAARALRPDAFLLYKPHPDVLTGLRAGAVDDDTLSLVDACAPEASAADCLAWADVVHTLTSLMGFEALLRDRAVTVHGRPFYAGWGLTEDAGEPFDRGRRLTLDELAAAALILYPRYVHPPTGLPAPPETVLDWLEAERAYVRTPAGRLRAAWRTAVSHLLNVVR